MREVLPDDVLIIEDHGPVRHLVLNRPAKRNALAAPLMAALLDAFEAAGADPKVGAVLLRGAGAGFCAGADLKETADLTEEAGIRAHADRLRRVLAAPQALGKPVVAQVHGFALGAGSGLALGCDAVFADPATSFGYPEARHAILPALVVPALVHRLGRTAAFELLATGRTFDGAEAATLGLARLAQGADLAAAAQRHAEALAARPPGLAGAIKALVREVEPLAPEAALMHAMEANVQARLARAAARRDAEAQAPARGGAHG